MLSKDFVGTLRSDADTDPDDLDHGRKFNAFFSVATSRVTSLATGSARTKTQSQITFDLDVSVSLTRPNTGECELTTPQGEYDLVEH
ncbi:MAG: hypothetical protein C5B49_16430 [Bdellovibrio sp.]|nr:MAG: hypothetical protein C5B49_16430 [Bdellovibrio sp.]